MVPSHSSAVSARTTLQRSLQSEPFAWFFRLATFIMVVVILRLGREVLLPITFAVLLVFLLGPSVVRLTRWGLHKALAILATVGLALAVTGAVGWLIADQAIRLGKELPSLPRVAEENLGQNQGHTSGGDERRSRVEDTSHGDFDLWVVVKSRMNEMRNKRTAAFTKTRRCTIARTHVLLNDRRKIDKGMRLCFSKTIDTCSG